MPLMVCIVCDELIEKKDDQVDYDIIASFFKYDISGNIFGDVDKPTKVHFHKKCFKKYKKEEKKQPLHFTQTIGHKRIVLMNRKNHKVYTGSS